MRLSVPARVGIITLITLVVLGVAVFWLGNFKFFGHPYRFKVWFPEVAGLGAGARVQYMGVRIGQVLSLAPAGNRVGVNVEIDDATTQIQRDATISIGQNGLLGEKVIDIQVNKGPLKHPGAYIKPDEEVEGLPAPSLQAIVGDVQYAVRKLRNFVDSPQNQKQIRLAVDRLMNATQSMSSAMANIEAITAKTKIIVARVEEVSDSAPELKAIVGNVRSLTRSLDATVRDMQRLVANPDNQRYLAATVRNLAGLTERTNVLLDDLHQVTGDAAVRNDLKAVIHEARDTMQNASAVTKALQGTLKGGSGFTFTGSGELLGSVGDPTAPYIQANLLGQFEFGPANFFRLGLQEAGGRNLVELQYGLRAMPALDLRFGIIRGKLGFGTDFHLTDRTDLVVNIFDTNTPIVRAALQQHIFGNWGLAAFYQRALPTGVTEVGLGVRWNLLTRE